MFKKLFGRKQEASAAPADPLEAAKRTYEDLKVSRGPTDQETLQALFALSKVLHERRLFDEEEQVGRQLLATFEEEFGPDHPNVGYGLDVVASALSGKGERLDALNYRKRGLNVLESHFGPDHEMTLQRARFLAIDFAESDQVSDAQAVLRKYMPATKTNPPLYAEYLSTKSFVTQKAEGVVAAIPVSEKLIEFYRENAQEETKAFASALYNVSLLYLENGQKMDALNALSEGGIVALGAYGPEHPAAQDIFSLQTELRLAHEAGEF